MLTTESPGVPAQREHIDRMIETMRAMPQADVPIEHTFGPGFYARTIRLKAGTTLGGKIHATEHIFAVSEGIIALVTDDVGLIVKAPFQKVCNPGVRRIGHALTDVVCTNIHLTNETDLVKLEALLVEPETALPATNPEVIAWLG